MPLVTEDTCACICIPVPTSRQLFECLNTYEDMHPDNCCMCRHTEKCPDESTPICTFSRSLDACALTQRPTLGSRYLCEHLSDVWSVQMSIHPSGYPETFGTLLDVQTPIRTHVWMFRHLLTITVCPYTHPDNQQMHDDISKYSR